MPPIGPPSLSSCLLKAHDVEILTQSDGFSILREHLARHYEYELCDHHATTHVENAARWLIVRDVLHALLVPVIELFDKAVSVAEQATHAQKVEDLESAFKGEAHDAFVWLSCFLEKERAWCYTHGCPACVVDHALDSEFTIRLLYAACLLSDVHYPFTLEGPTLPSFMFFLDSLHKALDLDSLYGVEYYDLMTPKAQVTRDGIEDLIRQYLELDATLSAPSTPSNPTSAGASVATKRVQCWSLWAASRG